MAIRFACQVLPCSRQNGVVEWQPEPSLPISLATVRCHTTTAPSLIVHATSAYADVLVKTVFLSEGQSEVEATLNLNAMNQLANPWHVSLSYAKALQNTCLKTWAKSNSLAQLGKSTGEGESEEAEKGKFVKGHVH